MIKNIVLLAGALVGLLFVLEWLATQLSAWIPL
jgi:hypothetical protein